MFRMRRREDYIGRMFSPTSNLSLLSLLSSHIKRCDKSNSHDNRIDTIFKEKRRRGRRRRSRDVVGISSNQTEITIATLTTFASMLAAVLFILSFSSGAQALASSPASNNPHNNNYNYDNNNEQVYKNIHQTIITPSVEQNKKASHSISTQHHHHHSRRRRHFNSFTTTTQSPRYFSRPNLNNYHKHDRLLANEIHFEDEENNKHSDRQVELDINHNNNYYYNYENANLIGQREQKLSKKKTFEESESNQQVPEQLPIVIVSSSDNSYVSASPILSIEENPSTTTTTTTTTLSSLHKDNNNYNQSSNNNHDYTRASLDANYHIKRATIIKTRESIESGATFINYTIVTNLEACLVECLITDSCDTAIYQESPVDFTNHLPFISPQIKKEHDYLTLLQLKKNHQRNSMLHNLYKRSLITKPTYDSDDIVENDSDVVDEEDDIDEEDDDGGLVGHSNDQDEDLSIENDMDDDIDNNINYNEFKLEKSISKRFGKKNKILERRKNNINKVINYNKSGFFICYLFQCAKLDGFKCQFSNHNYYISSIRKEALDAEKLPKQTLPIGFIKTLRPTNLLNNNEDVMQTSASEDKKSHYIVESSDSLTLDKGFIHNNEYNNMVEKPHYSKIVGNHYQPSINGRRWHDTHVASIRIGQEEYENYGRGGWNSALIAIMFGIIATAMIIMVVGHKMNSIKRKIAIKGRRRSIVPDTDFLINTIPTM